MSLLGLPQELIDSILDVALARGGFESFVLTCKTAHRASKKHLRRYHELRTAWREVPSATNPSTTETALSIIEAIVREPEVARFVEALDLSSVPDLDRDTEDDNWRIIDETLLERAKQLVLESLAIKIAGQDPEGWMLAVHDDRDYTMSSIVSAAKDDSLDHRSWCQSRVEWNIQTQHDFMQVIRTIFLLTLLPNLKELTLPTSFGYITGHYSDAAPSYFLGLLNSMMGQVLASPKDVLPLSRLERLHPFQELEYQYSPKTGFTELAPFTVLPRMRDMNLRNMIATNKEEEHSSRDEEGLMFKWSYGQMTSNIRTLHLEGCCMDAEGLGELLKHTPQLESLYYTHHPKYRGIGVLWRAGDFIAMIQENCWQTLKTLRFGTHYRERSYWGAPNGMAPSLKKFEMLETLVMPLNLLRGSEGGLSTILPNCVKHVGLICEENDLLECHNHDPDPETGARSGPAAFKNADAIRSLGLEDLTVFVHNSGDNLGDLVSPTQAELQASQKAGARLVAINHERDRTCSCVAWTPNGA